MAENLKVLVWGHAEDGPCAYFRGHQMRDELLKLGIEYKGISTVNLDAVAGAEKYTTPEAFSKGLIKVDAKDVDWADVIVFRRYYNTSLYCKQCNFVTLDYMKAGTHEHGPAEERDLATRLLWPVFAFGNHGKAIIYETDDDHFNITSWNGYYKDVQPELDMVSSMAKRADLVTTSTQVIGNRYARFNDNVRVIKNAIDPELYKATEARPDGDKARMVYYGGSARMRDYLGFPKVGKPRKIEGGYCAKAMHDMREELHRVWIGGEGDFIEKTKGIFDEHHPYQENIAEFCKLLANTHPDIGVAPLMGDTFDQAKSELHWLEYSMVGAAFIGERIGNLGPYSMVKNGIDGFVVKGRQEWYDAVKKLARNPSMRADMAAAAKERVLKEYNYKDRAKEWADAFRWAAENRGRGAKVA